MLSASRTTELSETVAKNRTICPPEPKLKKRRLYAKLSKLNIVFSSFVDIAGRVWLNTPGGEEKTKTRNRLTILDIFYAKLSDKLIIVHKRLPIINKITGWL